MITKPLSELRPPPISEGGLLKTTHLLKVLSIRNSTGQSNFNMSIRTAIQKQCPGSHHHSSSARLLYSVAFIVTWLIYCLSVQKEKSVPAGQPWSLCSGLTSQIDHFSFVFGFDFPLFQQPIDRLNAIIFSVFVPWHCNFPQLLYFLNSPPVLNNFPALCVFTAGSSQFLSLFNLFS